MPMRASKRDLRAVLERLVDLEQVEEAEEAPAHLFARGIGVLLVVLLAQRHRLDVRLFGVVRLDEARLMCTTPRGSSCTSKRTTGSARYQFMACSLPHSR